MSILLFKNKGNDLNTETRQYMKDEKALRCPEEPDEHGILRPLRHGLHMYLCEQCETIYNISIRAEFKLQKRWVFNG